MTQLIFNFNLKFKSEKSQGWKIGVLLFAAVVAVISVNSQPNLFAAEPTGSNWFAFHASPFTGGDDTGDGSTGSLSALNYYYVGQNFVASMAVSSSGTTASNIWVDYDTELVSVSNLTTGSFFNSWQGQDIESGRITSTGYNFPVSESSGEGEFGTLQVSMFAPTAANYDTSTPSSLDIVTGSAGGTTEANIALNGQDIMNDAEDFQFHVWADTKKPYVTNTQPADQSVDVSVESIIAFELRDSLNGNGDDSGVGTGVNMTSSQADITFDDGLGATSIKTYSTESCSGVWGSNLCEFSMIMPALTSYTADTRKWNYGTAYTIEVSGYEDMASISQDQLGDANGPNLMNPASFTFTTESDIMPPQVQNHFPSDGSVDLPVGTNVSFEIEDRKSYPDGISGSGVDLGSCRIDITSPSFGNQTFSTGMSEVTASEIDYGYQIDVNPVSAFSSGEAVTVTIYDCVDIDSNVMAQEIFTFNIVILDTDRDGVLDGDDNCLTVPNVSQADSDLDGIGDACDTSFDLDSDGDGTTDDIDNCPSTSNADQANLDADEFGDLCDIDIDNDTVLNNSDNCPFVENTGQEDFDEDGDGDVCDADDDNDTVPDTSDNCPFVQNTNQADLDGNGVGDACDQDSDGDGILNNNDNCPVTANTDQADLDEDGFGDVCDADDDGDTIEDSADNCPAIPNTGQSDVDEDGLGDDCDPDADGDTVLNEADNCPLTSNSEQSDINEDGLGDACQDDADGDGVLNEDDNCPLTPNTGQEDIDEDEIGDVCDPDMDEDTILNEDDNCPMIANEDQKDTDEDLIGDVCDPDMDEDTILNEDDNCPLIVNEEQEDLDEDGFGDVCDIDMDDDTFVNMFDNCPTIWNEDQADFDEDGIGDVCDQEAGLTFFDLGLDEISPELLGKNATFIFYHRETGTLVLMENVVFSVEILGGLFNSDLMIGTYDIALKFDSYLTQIIRDIPVTGSFLPPILLAFDYEALVNGDLINDDIINSFDLSILLSSYGTDTLEETDFNNDGITNSMDIATLILNYFIRGETF